LTSWQGCDLPPETGLGVELGFELLDMEGGGQDGEKEIQGEADHRDVAGGGGLLQPQVGPDPHRTMAAGVQYLQTSQLPGLLTPSS